MTGRSYPDTYQIALVQLDARSWVIHPRIKRGNSITALPAKPKAKIGCISWLGRILLGAIVLLIVFLTAGIIFQAIGARRDRANFPPPGQMVDIGGYQLHIYCMGEGSPTVILETLSGGMSPYWAWVQPAVAAHTRVCAYDRAGRAWSQPRLYAAEDPARQTALELHTLLEKASIAGPYILVGHSIGGIYARRYTGLFPQEVSGMVLIDAAHPDQLVRYPELLKEAEAYGRLSSVFPFLARIGLFRMYFATGGEIDFQDLPQRQHDETAAFWSSPEYFTSQRGELNDALKIYASNQNLGDLGDLPLMVITASETGPYPAWPVLQEELARLSTDSTHQVIAGAAHSSLVFNPDHAEQVSAAILRVVEAVRDGKRLAE